MAACKSVILHLKPASKLALFTDKQKMLLVKFKLVLGDMISLKQVSNAI